MNSVYPIFSYPVMVCSENYKFTSGEKKYISELEMFENVGNLMSRSDRILESAELSNLKAFIDSQIYVYKNELLRMKDENEIYITQSWANNSKPDQFHPKHNHPNSIISGVMFFNENDGDGLPPLRFHRTIEMFPLAFVFNEINEFNSGGRWFEPIQGRLILFPSLLEHGVEKNKSSKVRITISFNTFVRGVIGDNVLLTEVNIL